jgi:glycosyltransferase involved in cell wall biosynthesis
MFLSIIILTKNEELNLATCLESLRSLETEIFIVDSGSTDSTVEIAKSFGCKVVEHPFVNQAQQLNWALANLEISNPWVMRLDADERLTNELAQELAETLPKSLSEVSGYQCKRRVYFMGKWIRHGGYYPTWLLRVWRNGIGTCEQRWMDEHMILSEGKLANLKFDIIDDNRKDLTFWIDKHNRYSDREVQDILSQSFTPDALLAKNDRNDRDEQAKQKRWAKKNLYGRTPLFLRAFLYFLFRYTIKLGFLDGMEGLIFHFLQGFWYRFLVDAKLYQHYKFNSSKQNSSSPNSIANKL